MSSPTATEDRLPDWNVVRSQLRDRLLRLTNATDADELDDLVQEATLRLYRISRTDTIREPSALMTTIAQRTWADYVRRRMRARIRARSIGAGLDEELRPQSPNAAEGDLRDRIAFVVHQLYVNEGASECSQLLAAYLDATEWKEVAREQGSSYAAVRKRWSRCLDLARRTLSSDPDLSGWLGPTSDRSGHA